MRSLCARSLKPCYNAAMTQPFLIAFFTVLILLIMGGTFLFFYLRSLRHELAEYWDTALDNLRLRLDKIPNLLETVRGLIVGQDKLIGELAELRSASWPMETASKDKVHKELIVSERLKAAWDLAQQFPELNRDTNFLALKMEFKDCAREIERALDAYNERVRHYNKAVRFLPWRPFVLLFRFSNLPIFEFEP